MRGQIQIPKHEIDAVKSVISKNFLVKKTKEQIFYDLCFCIMAPQTKFVNNTKVTRELWDKNFYNWLADFDISELETIVKPVRFFRNKSRYLKEAKENFDDIYEHVTNRETGFAKKRVYLVQKVNGLGLKASSHFLRNLGCQELAIIDTHIMKFLDYPYNTPKNAQEYFKIEKEFHSIATKNKLTIAELDAWIWATYSKTPLEKFVS